MWEILTLLRQLNELRDIRWGVDPDEGECIVVHIPVNEEDVQMVHDLKALLAPKEGASA